MDCLKNYIQIEGCGSPEYSYNIAGQPATPSGLYINRDLPITIKQIDKVANDVQETFLGLWDEVQDRGIKRFAIRVKNGYRELFSLCNIDDTLLCNNREALAMPLLYFLGAELMTAWIYSDRINRYTTIDRDRALDLRAEFDREFPMLLKGALEHINAGQDEENGDAFHYQEVLP